MVVYLAVCPADRDTIALVDHECSDWLEAAMHRALGYSRIKLTISLAPGAFLVATAPLGAVKNAEDGERLLAELQRSLPETPFCVRPQAFDAAAFVRASGSIIGSAQPQVALVA